MALAKPVVVCELVALRNAVVVVFLWMVVVLLKNEKELDVTNQVATGVGAVTVARETPRHEQAEEYAESDEHGAA